MTDRRLLVAVALLQVVTLVAVIILWQTTNARLNTLCRAIDHARDDIVDDLTPGPPPGFRHLDPTCR
jgi:hypothetical protein